MDTDNSLPKEFVSIKFILNSDLLSQYDPSLEAIIAAGTSEHGLGAVAQHRWPEGSVQGREK
jgi:hypothetical protein